MILIAHRGNVSGRIPEMENDPEYITLAIKRGYSAEADVWYTDGKFFLGHDYPKYEVPEIFLWQVGLWCHAKTPETLYQLMKMGVHCFFHSVDDVTLTSQGFLWTYPNETLTPMSIAVMCEPNSICAGVCSDNVEKYL